MSGGVDSSVVAALLAREGYDVVGVTMQLYDHGAATHRKGACCAGQDIHDARDVAAAPRRSPLRARLRDPVSREGDRAVRARLCLGRDADPLRRLQSADEVRRPVRGGAGNSAPIFSPPAITSFPTRTAAAGAHSTAPPTPSATRAISSSPPRASSSRCCVSRWAACPSRRCARWRANSASPSPTRPTARTSASCRPATTAR